MNKEFEKVYSECNGYVNIAVQNAVTCINNRLKTAKYDSYEINPQKDGLSRVEVTIHGEYQTYSFEVGLLFYDAEHSLWVLSAYNDKDAAITDYNEFKDSFNWCYLSDMVSLSSESVIECILLMDYVDAKDEQ